MKICWDNLNNLYITRNGTFRRNGSTMLYMDSCSACGDPYLTFKLLPSIFCCRSCSFSGDNNPFYGKKHSILSKEKIAFSRGDRFRGSNNPNYKGGLWNKNIPLYDTYAAHLCIVENVRKDPNNDLILQARCAYCGQWFTPNRSDITERIKVINGKTRGEARLYCSVGCKKACPIYGRRKYPRGFKITTSREVIPSLRQMVFERDNWVCQLCGISNHEAELHCHHIEPVSSKPLIQNDVDVCITLCKTCHKKVHSKKGCRYIDLKDCKRG